MSGSYTTTRTPKPPGKKKTKNGVLATDEYNALWLDKSTQPATVSMSVGRSTEFGVVRVSASVALQCDQTEGSINRAGELAFNKACELVNDGWSILVPEEK
jgi:hypothetical protein